MENSVLRNFTKFTEKHLCQSLFFNKVAGLRPVSKNIFFTKHVWTTASIDSSPNENIFKVMTRLCFERYVNRVQSYQY